MKPGLGNFNYYSAHTRFHTYVNASSSPKFMAGSKPFTAASTYAISAGQPITTVLLDNELLNGSINNF